MQVLLIVSFRFLDVANASSIPHVLRNLMLMVFLFYRTILSCLETEKSVEFNLPMQILQNSQVAETAVPKMSAWSKL